MLQLTLQANTTLLVLHGGLLPTIHFLKHLVGPQQKTCGGGAARPLGTALVVLNSRWNRFVFKNFGYFSSRLRNAYYNDASTVAAIKQNMVDCDDLWTALSVFQGNETYDAIEHIKVVVKQLTDQTDWH